ncbi:DUF2341 domain-containing protein [Thermococcus sp.]
MKVGRRQSSVIALALIIIVTLTTVGLAVPNISMNVQSVGVGSCQISAPANWVDVHVSWNVTSYTFFGIVYYVYTLSNITLNFSNALSSETFLFVNVTIYGLNANTGNYQNDSFLYNTTLTNGLPLGATYVINNTNQSYSYYVIPGYVDPPKILNIAVVLKGGSSLCGLVPIYVNVENLGVAYFGNTPSGPGNLTILVNNTNGVNFTNYVLNFTMSGNWSALYPYITTLNGTRLYYWYYYNPSQDVTLFWVRFNLTSSLQYLKLFYGNSTAYNPIYTDPRKVFTFFDDFEGTSLNTSAWNIPSSQNLSDYNVSNSLLELKSGQWLWTNENFSGSFYIDLYAKSLNSTSFPIFYIDNTSYGWTILLNASIIKRGTTTYQFNNTTIRGFNVVNGTWGAFYYPDGGSGNPVFGNDILVTTLINVTGTQADFYLYENGSLIANFTQYPAEQNEPLGLGQWYEYNYSSVGPWWNPTLILNSIINTTSIYDWIGVWPYVYPSPQIKVLLPTGDYTFRLYFRP